MSHAKNVPLGSAGLQQEFASLKEKQNAAAGKGLKINALRNEQRFLEYIRLLHQFSKRYMVMISARDTPGGTAYTKEVSAEVMKLGLKADLNDKDRYAYAAAIDAGEVVYESLSASAFELVEHTFVIDDVSFELKSIGFNVPQNSAAIIGINGVNHSPNRRGLNFVVYDRVTGYVLDAVNFDTFSVHFPCYRPSAITQGLLKYKEDHPDISFLCFSTPMFPKDNLSLNEMFIREKAIGRVTILNNIDKPIFAINKYFDSKDDIIEVLNAPKSYHDAGGVRRFYDVQGRCVNTLGGHRVTEWQPEKGKRTVFIIGGCVIFGVGASDKGTIASHLQKLFNELAADEQLVVENYGFYLAESKDAGTNEELAILDALPAKPGDIILCHFAMLDAFPCLDMSMSAARPHSYGEVFFDTQHYTEDGNRLIAEKLFEKIKQLDFFSDHGEGTHKAGALQSTDEGADYGLDMQSKKELADYKRILKEFYDSMFGIRIGAIVMNCNPFTLGHRYLIEQAAANCDHLIIFVVQEDKSVFPFDERLRMVDDGTADLKNVTVVPSGRFIISSLTFSDYFNKSELQDQAVDSSMDVTLFAREIAPCLNISVRFVGEEPYDKVTRQYNDTLRAILPRYGIEFVEIPRKEWGGRPISASRVRELMKDRNFGEIEKMVPATTLTYLKAKF
jgi:[citrate (pro-3S)-lyase] ligase